MLGNNNNSPLFKPDDLVRTPAGRTAKVLSVLPNHEREIQFIDGEREVLVMKLTQLRFVQASKPHRWLSRLPPE